MKSTVTVLIPAYNDERTIEIVLQAVIRLAYRPIEIIVADDGSSDGTAGIVRRFPVTSIRNDANHGLGYNLNAGLQRCEGEFLAVVQSDCEVIGEDWLDRMLEPMADPQVGVVVSQREIPGFGGLTAGARLFNAVVPQDLLNRTGKLQPLDYCRGKADLYRVSLLRELGGWDSAFFTAGEDTDLSIRLKQKGAKILLHPEAKIRYLFSGRQNTVGGALNKALLYGKTAALLYRKHRYDGIQSRTYLLILLAAVSLLLPFPLFTGIVLLLWSFTCRVQTARSKGFPFGVSALILAVLYSSRCTGPWQECGMIPAMAIVFAGIAYTAYLSVKNTFRNYRRGERWWRLPVTFLFCFLWRMLSGAGYLSGAFGYRPRISKTTMGAQSHGKRGKEQ
jgi:glycosyltransferase involved in cell wall biosynthesis